ncbi:MAG TPA: MFS transporter, partial [Anaeromyxobacteraceae bacterium]
MNGAAFANWVTRIPQVQRRLGLGEAALGFALFGVAAGALVAMPLTGRLVGRWGSGPATRWLALAFCASLPLPALAPSFAWLVLALVALGAANGGMDVAMNAQAAAVERTHGAPVMSSFHALYSTGGLLGALSGAAFAGRGVPPPAHLAAVALALGLVALAAGRGLLPGQADAYGEAGPPLARPDRSLLALAALAFCVLLCEGAIADWSAVYMVKVTGSSAAMAAAAFAAFSLAMAVGRFAGDGLTRRFGPARLVRGGGLLAAAGLGVGLATAHPFA